MNKTKKRILQVVGILLFAASVGAVNSYMTAPRYALPSGTSLMGSTNGDATPSTPSEKADKIGFDVIGGWEYEENKTPIPDDVKKLDGKYVEMTGFMISYESAETVKEFLLVQSLWSCCYGQPPAVNHQVQVKFADGRAMQYYYDPIRVRGKFRVAETREDGYLVSLYQIIADEVVAK